MSFATPQIKSDGAIANWNIQANAQASSPSPRTTITNRVEKDKQLSKIRMMPPRVPALMDLRDRLVIASQLA